MLLFCEPWFGYSCFAHGKHKHPAYFSGTPKMDMCFPCLEFLVLYFRIVVCQIGIPKIKFFEPGFCHPLFSANRGLANSVFYRVDVFQTVLLSNPGFTESGFPRIIAFQIVFCMDKTYRSVSWNRTKFIRADGFNTQELAMQGSFRAFLGY